MPHPFGRAAEALLRPGIVRRELQHHALELLASALWVAVSAETYRRRGQRVPDLPPGPVLARAAARQARRDAAAGYRVLPRLDPL